MLVGDREIGVSASCARCKKVDEREDALYFIYYASEDEKTPESKFGSLIVTKYNYDFYRHKDLSDTCPLYLEELILSFSNSDNK